MNSILRAFFALQFIGILFYTLCAAQGHGWNLVSVFFNEMSSFTWSGQFNFDFLNYLVLSAIWISWRHQYSSLGIILGLTAAVLGLLFFAPYLLWASLQAKGNPIVFFMGLERATASE